MENHDIQIAAGVELASAVTSVGDDGEFARILLRLGLDAEDLLIETLDNQIEDLGARSCDDQTLASGTMLDLESVGFDLEEIAILWQLDTPGGLLLESQDLFGTRLCFFQ